MKRLVVILAVLSFACSDNNNGGINCTDEYVPGLSVTVKDSLTGKVLEKGVTVIAADGNYTEELEMISESSSGFYGAFERTGSYTLTVSKQGYRSHTSDSIELDADQCHVITQEVTVELQAE
jgi:hypothetical protein